MCLKWAFRTSVKGLERNRSSATSISAICWLGNWLLIFAAKQLNSRRLGSIASKERPMLRCRLDFKHDEGVSARPACGLGFAQPPRGLAPSTM